MHVQRNSGADQSLEPLEVVGASLSFSSPHDKFHTYNRQLKGASARLYASEVARDAGVPPRMMRMFDNLRAKTAAVESRKHSHRKRRPDPLVVPPVPISHASVSVRPATGVITGDSQYGSFFSGSFTTRERGRETWRFPRDSPRTSRRVVREAIRDFLKPCSYGSRGSVGPHDPSRYKKGIIPSPPPKGYGKSYGRSNGDAVLLQLEGRKTGIPLRRRHRGNVHGKKLSGEVLYDPDIQMAELEAFERQVDVLVE